MWERIIVWKTFGLFMLKFPLNLSRGSICTSVLIRRSRVRFGLFLYDCLLALVSLLFLSHRQFDL